MGSEICVWTDLNLCDVIELNSCASPLDVKGYLCRKFNFELESLTLKENILIDLYYHTILFAKEHNFNEEQTSAFFSIIKKTHEKAVESPYGNLEDTFSYFKNILACHSVKRPPFYVHLFLVNEINEISDYVVNTYFRHFKLYKYAFTPKIVMDVKINYKGVVEEEMKEDEVTPHEVLIDEEQDVDTQQEDDIKTEEAPQEDETPAVKELKNIIETTLEEHINKLRLHVDQKLKVNEENITKKMAANSKDGTSPPKSAKKGKKK